MPQQLLMLRKIRNLLNKIANIESTLLNQTYGTVTNILLFGNLKYSNDVNLKILDVTTDYILTPEKFNIFAFFRRYWRYTGGWYLVVLGDCHVICFICKCNDDYHQGGSLVIIEKNNTINRFE